MGEEGRKAIKIDKIDCYIKRYRENIDLGGAGEKKEE